MTYDLPRLIRREPNSRLLSRPSWRQVEINGCKEENDLINRDYLCLQGCYPHPSIPLFFVSKRIQGNPEEEEMLARLLTARSSSSSTKKDPGAGGILPNTDRNTKYQPQQQLESLNSHTVLSNGTRTFEVGCLCEAIEIERSDVVTRQRTSLLTKRNHMCCVRSSCRSSCSALLLAFVSTPTLTSPAYYYWNFKDFQFETIPCSLCTTWVTLALNGFYGYWYGDVLFLFCAAFTNFLNHCKTM